MKTNYGPSDSESLAAQRLILIDRLLSQKEGQRQKKTRPEERFTRYRDAPVAFVREVLGEEPWGKQAEILAALGTARRVAVRSSHGVGKTWTAARAALWFLMTRPNSVVITTAPTWKQVRDLLWREVRSAHRAARQPLLGRCNTAGLEIDSRWFAVGLSTNEPINFQGFHAEGGLLFIADEASGVAEAIYEAGKGFLTGPDSYELLIGNPNHASGTFYEAFKSDRWTTFHINAFDAPEQLVSREWIDDRRAEWGEDSPAFQVRVLGEFPEQGDDSLISMRWVMAAQQRQLTPGARAEMGVDIARYGSDSSVCYIRHGDVVTAGESWRGNDTMTSAGRVAAAARELRPLRINVDVIGVGAGVVDRLKEQGLPVVGVNVGEAAIDKERFANRRAELFWNLRERFQRGEIQVPETDTTLLGQLTSLRFHYTSRGQILLESKDDLRRRGLPSPDWADALALCFAGPPPGNPLAGIVAHARARGW